MSRWVSEPQCKQPWNAIGGVPALPVGSGPVKDVAEEYKEKDKDSVHATNGGASSERLK